MSAADDTGPIDVLLIEDNAGDARLVVEVLKELPIPTRLSVVTDGEAAVQHFADIGRQERRPPGLVLLDLNLPYRDGREVLAFLKSSEQFRRIPVVVLTSSRDPADIAQAYDLHANCYVAKPVDYDCFSERVRGIVGFWLSMTELRF